MTRSIDDFYVFDGDSAKTSNGLCSCEVQNATDFLKRGDTVIFERGRATFLSTPPLIKIHKEYLLGYITGNG